MTLARTITTGPETLTEARAVLREVVPGLTALVRNIHDPGAASIGTWKAAEVAAHISHAFHGDTAALAGGPLPPATVTKAGMDDFTAGLLAGDGERDPAVIADRITEWAGEFDAAAARTTGDPVSWLQGAQLAPSVVACHLLEETLVHGHDIAKATGQRWPISRRHCVLVVEGFMMQLIQALPPTALVKPGSFRVRMEMRLRGGGSTIMVFDRGSLTIEPEARGGIDVHVDTCPATIMLTFMRRQSIVRPMLAGKVLAWGPRPWKAMQLLSVISTP